MNNCYLNDQDFLKELDQYRHKITHVKIISLDFKENPVEEISGQVIDGNINIDGKSAVRRTCSLSMTAENINIHDFYWGLNSKIKIYIGLENHINSDYPEIIWFLQGVFVITEFSITETTNNFTISVQGMDKMCLLDGTIGGNLPTEISFSSEDENGNIEVPTIRDIIYSLISTQGKELTSNIVINNIGQNAQELVSYSADDEDENLYLIINCDSQQPIKNLKFNCEFFPKVDDVDNVEYKKVQTLCKNTSINLYRNNYNEEKKEYEFSLAYNDFATLPSDSLYSPTDIGEMAAIEKSEKLYLKSDSGNYIACYIIKIENNDLIGYINKPLIYGNGEKDSQLVCGVGETITSVLDKIVQRLQGNFEYFYDIYGRFVFQQKPGYLNIEWNNNSTLEEDEYYSNLFNLSSNIYIFDNTDLITNISNKPNLQNVKNDYSVWGYQDGIPIHYRYAIDNKPIYYKSFDGIVYIYDSSNSEYYIENISNSDYVVQYRRVGLTKSIYDYSLKQKNRLHWYYKTNYGTYKEYNLDYDNIDEFDNSLEYYIKIALEKDSKIVHCDWREIIYQMALDYYAHYSEDTFKSQIIINNRINEEENKYSYYYPYGITGYEQYYADILENWRKIYNPLTEEETVVERINYNNIKKRKNKVRLKEFYIPIKKMSSQFNISDIIENKYQNTNNIIPDLEDIKLFVAKNPYLPNATWGELETLYNSNNNFINSNEYYINDLLDFINFENFIKDNIDNLYYSPSGSNLSVDFVSVKELYNELIALGELIGGGNNDSLEHINGLYNSNQIYKKAISNINSAAEKANLNFVFSSNEYNINTKNENINRGYGYDKVVLDRLLNKIFNILPFTFEEREEEQDGYNTIKQLRLIEGHLDYDKWLKILKGKEEKRNNFWIKKEKTVIKQNDEGEDYEITESYYVHIIQFLYGEDNKWKSYFNNSCSSCYAVKKYSLSEAYSFEKLLNSIYEDTEIEDLDYITSSLYIINEKNGFYHSHIHTLETDYLGRIYNDRVYSGRSFNSKINKIEYYMAEEGFDLITKWTKKIELSQESVLFWLDFLDTGEITKYGVPLIGDRVKAETDNNISALTYKTIYPIQFLESYKRKYIEEEESVVGLYDLDENGEYKLTKDSICINSEKEYYEKTKQTENKGYISIDLSYCYGINIDNFQSVGAKKSAQNVIQNYLQNYTYSASSISIQAIPIYRLEPNNLISVVNKELNINGQFLLNSINLPLTYSGLMSITATEIPSIIY